MTADPDPGVRPALRDTLAAAAATLGLSVSTGQSAQLLDFVELLTRWNRTYNLTAIRDPVNMLTQHVVDCLAVVPALRREGRGGRILDVGSGGGLPGLVFAVLEPAIDVTCADSVGKKAAFVRQAAAALGLHNLHSEHARVEALKAAPFDLITSRAFATLQTFVTLTAPLLKEGGVWMAMKGKTPAEEIDALPRSVEVFHVEPLRVPGLEAERCLVWMRSIAAIARQDKPSTLSVDSLTTTRTGASE